ncbi:hypothetical protein [Streptomyces tsukubensis]|uniref:hypothetical protein n=1 Tax=Streptomyces tsukubensis TaxID=83656 RepID=UPI00117F31F8|nr:hypothetical protein [Streptomyces tsukubensis]QFR95375.1 hypothetical protein GBW32_23050 [Streptomyces tsukubensis]
MQPGAILTEPSHGPGNHNGRYGDAQRLLNSPEFDRRKIRGREGADGMGDTNANTDTNANANTGTGTGTG